MDTVKIIGINDINECRRLCNVWLSCKEALAVDAEGIGLSAQGRLTLLQIGTVDGQVYLLDVINPDDISDENSGKRLLMDGGIKEVLETNVILKIMHSCKNDCGALYHQFGISVENIFDTQAAWLTLQCAEGTLIPIRRPIEELIETYLQTTLNKKDFKDEWLHDRYQYWARRPLTENAIEYAAGDVFFLHRLYEVMNSELQSHPNMESLYKIYLDIEVNGEIETERTKSKEKELQRKSMIQFWDKLSQEHNPQCASGTKLSENEKRAVKHFYLSKFNGALNADDNVPPSFQPLINRMLTELTNDFQLMERDGLDSNYEMDVYLLSKYADGKMKSAMKKLHWSVRVLQAKPLVQNVIQNIDAGKVRKISDLDSKGLASLEKYREFQEELFRKRYIKHNRTLQHLEWELNQQQIEHWEEQVANGTFRENITIKVEMILKTIQKRDRYLKDRAGNLIHKINSYKSETI